MGDMADYYDDRMGYDPKDFESSGDWYGKPYKRKRRAPLGKKGLVAGTETATTVDVRCANRECNIVFTAKKADRKRGWGKFCSKSCKASKQYEKTGRQW